MNAISNSTTYEGDSPKLEDILSSYHKNIGSTSDSFSTPPKLKRKGVYVNNTTQDQDDQEGGAGEAGDHIFTPKPASQKRQKKKGSDLDQYTDEDNGQTFKDYYELTTNLRFQGHPNTDESEKENFFNLNNIPPQQQQQQQQLQQQLILQQQQQLMFSNQVASKINVNEISHQGSIPFDNNYSINSQNQQAINQIQLLKFFEMFNTKDEQIASLFAPNAVFEIINSTQNATDPSSLIILLNQTFKFVQIDPASFTQEQMNNQLYIQNLSGVAYLHQDNSNISFVASALIQQDLNLLSHVRLQFSI